MHYGFNADIPTFLGQCVIYFLKSKTKVRGTSPKWALKCLIKEGLTTLNISKNAHLDQLVEPLWPQVVRCVEEEADEGTLSILPLQRRYLITTVQHLRIKTSAFLASAYFAPAYLLFCTCEFCTGVFSTSVCCTCVFLASYPPI